MNYIMFYNPKTCKDGVMSSPGSWTPMYSILEKSHVFCAISLGIYKHTIINCTL